MTIDKLAKLANVAQSTVSKAFSGSPEISEKTRERIFQIAKEHGCFDKYNKKKFKKRVIAVICPEIESEHYSSLVKHLMKHTEERDAIMALSITGFDPEKENELYTYYSCYCRIDGIIVMDPCRKYSNDAMLPTVYISSDGSHKEADNLHFSLEKAMYDILLTLKKLGHTHIGFAGEPLTPSEQEHFQNAAAALSIPVSPSQIKLSQKRFEEAGRDTVRQWISEGCLPTAIIAAYDYIAIGVMKELSQNGYSVPEDVSVVGINDITLAEFLDTPLSSVSYPKEELCREAVSLIFKKIDNQYYRARRITEIPAQFIPRESIGAVKKSTA